MKVFIGGFQSCSVHTERDTIERLLIEKEIEITDEPKDADINIITDTCIGTYKKFLQNFKYLITLLKIKKNNSKIILSGCLSKGVKFELSQEQKQILNQVEIVKPEDIVDYIISLCKLNKENINIPFYHDNDFIKFSPVTGCINNCSFCKVAYQNFNLQSYKIEDIEKIKKYVLENNINYVTLFSSNLSLYGVDLYKKQKAHEVIKMFSELDCVKYINCGCLINFYPELIEEIIKNPKIKKIHVSLETGSIRLYNLMNRPITLEKWINIIENIRKNRPDIIISTEIIAGYPTENIDDIKMTIDLVKKYNLYISNIFPYMDSPQIPSSKLPQNTKEYIKSSEFYYKKELTKTNNKILDDIHNGECYILNKDDEYEEYTLLFPDGSIEIINFEDLKPTYNQGEFINIKSSKTLKK